MQLLRRLWPRPPARAPVSSPPPATLPDESLTDADHVERTPMAPASERPAVGAVGPEVFQGALAELAARLEAVAADVNRLGREQFRATTLLEGQGADLDELAELWREHLRQRERETASLGQVLAELEGRARLALVRDLLPVADALSESIRSARELLAERDAPAAAASRRFPSFLVLPPFLVQRLGPRVAPADRAQRARALESWLEGLVLVERRLQALLEREGVRPIPTVGEVFDPHRHLAVAVAHDSTSPAGTIVSEEVRGYTIGERVLRPAEVVVAGRES